MATPNPTELEAFLAAERSQESSGSYTAQNPGGASGAYQFEPGTWSEWVTRAGYPQFAGRPAAQAPSYVQDAAASAMATSDYSATGSWLTTAEDWYYPAVAGTPAADSYVPAGNRLTVGQYGADVIGKMQTDLAGGSPAELTSSTLPPGLGLIPGVPGIPGASSVAGDVARPIISWLDNYAMRAALFVIGGFAILYGLVHLTRPSSSSSSPASRSSSGRSGGTRRRPENGDERPPTSPESSPDGHGGTSGAGGAPAGAEGSGAGADISATLDTAAADV